MTAENTAQVAELGDLDVIQSVCSSYWDEIAEEYVDEAGRACLEAIVTTPPMLTLHEVTVETVGVVGIQVERLRCRDHTENPVSPGPPSDVCLALSFLRGGEVFATTPPSQPLRPAKLSGGDETSAASDISSISATILEGSVGDSSVVTEAIQQLIGVWGKTNNGGREMVTFDSCLEVSSNGEPANGIDIVVHLVEAAGGGGSEETLASVPLAVGGLQVEGNGSENSMVCDIPLHDPFPTQNYPPLRLPNPTFVGGRQFVDGAGEEKSKPPVYRKRKGLAKLFAGRNKIDKRGEEKKEEDHDNDDNEDDDSIGLCNPFSPFVNDAYLLDQVKGAFLRFKVEWKEKEFNFEVNLQDGLPEERLSKENSITEPSKAEDGAEFFRETRKPPTVSQLELSLHPSKHRTTISERAVKPLGAPKRPSASMATAKLNKKSKSKPFFFRKKKAKDQKPPITDLSELCEPSENGIEAPEEYEPALELEQKTRKAAVLLEIRERAVLVPGNERANEIEVMSPPTINEDGTRERNEEAHEDGTVNTMFDTVYKAVVGHVRRQGDDERVETESNSLSAESFTSQKDRDTEKEGGDFVPAGTALCPVLANTPAGGGFTSLDTDVESVDGTGEDGKAGNEANFESSIGNSTQMASNDGLYAQFVQATSTLLQGYDAISQVESKEVDASSPHEPIPALELYPAPCDADRKEGSKENPQLQQGPIDIDAVDDGEVWTSDDEVDLVPATRPLRVTTPSPQELSMERVLSWSDKRLEVQKSQRFGFGRRRRGCPTGETSESIVTAPTSSRNLKVSLPSQVDTGIESPETETDPITTKRPPRPPSSIPRNPREDPILYRNDPKKKESKGRLGIRNRMAPSGHDTVSSSKETPKRRNLWGKIFRTKSSSSSGTPLNEKESVLSTASVYSDADTVEMDNMAKLSVINALNGNEEQQPQGTEPFCEGNMKGLSDTAELPSPTKNEEPNQVARPGCSLLDVFSRHDSESGPVEVDRKDVWLYAKDDETYATKETQPRSVEDDLTLIPSPADVFISETYHRCGPAKIADLGDAVIEESRHLVNRTCLLREKSDNETLATYTFDEPTFDPSVFSSDAKTASEESRAQSPRSEWLQHASPPNSAASRSRMENSPKEAAKVGVKEEQSKAETFSEAFLNLVTCRFAARDTLGCRGSAGVPSELIRPNDTDSVGDLTLTTYEMQVEVEQFKKKIEKIRHQAENLDENGDEVDNDAALVFQPPSDDWRSR